ncbi:SCO family protein [Croceivirga thetidis]|uniref:SCO family protein n=1 Tax=Croceivirga thetidis TaxID=2721623 RepID=A0ABX1GKG3_9FLAO|nr:SCO family protein [Croceivirga thetidis]NKI30382.1 SCO family protein [Croceivirga thetidis]
MKWFKSKFGICILTLLVSCNTQVKKEKSSRVEKLPFYNDASFTPHWVDSESEQSGLHQIPPFEVINQFGDTITEQTFNDKIYVTDFFFTSCPGICPKMTNNMLLVQEAFEEDEEVLLLSHSVTPEYDSVPVLKHYADAKGVLEQKWHLVTGNRNEIYKLGRTAYFVDEDLGEPKGLEDFLHTENFILIDKNRHIRGIYNGLNKTAISQLIADIKTLKKEG